MRRLLPVLLATIPALNCASSSQPVSAQPAHAPPAVVEPQPAAVAVAPDDRIRLAEAFRLAEAIGDDIWPGWSSAPLAVLLVTPQREFLIRHRQPPTEFSKVGFDSLLKSDVFARDRVFSPGLLATFPFAGVPTIVVGSAKATGKSSTFWVLTVLHEHFHQLQMSRPAYFSDVDALGLARGDQTGMWMLNFPFPYDSAPVRRTFAAYSSALDEALASAVAERGARWASIADLRGQLRHGLSADDEKYLAFQMWQEGIARYTELQVARWAAKQFTPSPAFTALGDVRSFADAATSIEAGIRTELRGDPLARSGRVAFYPAGAATALLLDDISPGWRARYLASGYSLEGLSGGR